LHRGIRRASWRDKPVRSISTIMMNVNTTRTVEIEATGGADDGPLAGRTLGLKDHIAVAGVPMTLGSHFMDGYIPDFDATIVSRLLDAGATIAGKMNMEDFPLAAPASPGLVTLGGRSIRITGTM
jgi:Asp-tRNA(Asn)/Glu-tRNA(Gln) amidotransferase A subunit family amidase